MTARPRSTSAGAALIVGMVLVGVLLTTLHRPVVPVAIRRVEPAIVHDVATAVIGVSLDPGRPERHRPAPPAWVQPRRASFDAAGSRYDVLAPARWSVAPNVLVVAAPTPIERSAVRCQCHRIPARGPPRPSSGR